MIIRMLIKEDLTLRIGDWVDIDPDRKTIRKTDPMSDKPIMSPNMSQSEKEGALEGLGEKRCKVTVMIEDECCRIPFQCRLLDGHKEHHSAVYPGLDGGVSMPVYWTDEAESCVCFIRNRRVT